MVSLLTWLLRSEQAGTTDIHSTHTYSGAPSSTHLLVAEAACGGNQHLGEYFFFGDLCFQSAISFLKHRRSVARCRARRARR